MPAKHRYPKERAKPPEPAAAAVAARFERDLKTVMRRYRAKEAALDEASGERDRVIRDAIEAGLAQARIADITGLSVQRVHQIRHGTRDLRD